MNRFFSFALLAGAVSACASEPVKPVVIATTTPVPTPTLTPARPPAPKPIEVVAPIPSKLDLSGRSAVRADNQLPLNSIAVPFATYLGTMHAKIHPFFADQYLRSLDNLPTTAPENQTRLVTRLELVIDAKGKIEKIGVVSASGVTAFDAAAIDSIMKAGPFPAPADVLLSYDNRVYVQWELYRDEVYACSTMHVRPYKLSN